MSEQISISIQQPKKRELKEFESTVGYINAEQVFKIVSYLNLELNPREPITNSTIVPEIINTLNNSRSLYPLKSKGILVASKKISYDESSSQESAQLKIGTSSSEGVLDGGHNLLAAVIYLLLRQRIDFEQSNMEWEELKTKFLDNFQSKSLLPEDDFLMPIEVISIKNSEGTNVKEIFSSVSHARNFNSQLKSSALANASGLYDYIKSKLSSDVLSNIAWRQNQKLKGEEITDIDLVVQLSWISLSLIDFKSPELNKLKISGWEAFQNPEKSINNYSELIKSKEVSKQSNGYDQKIEITNITVKSALDLIPLILDAYDLIYRNFSRAYNLSGGKFGKLTLVQNQDEISYSPFKRKKLETAYPPIAFIMPVIYSTQQLIGKYPIGHERENQFDWIMNPVDFFSDIENLSKIVGQVRMAYEVERNLHKIGSSTALYELTASTAYRLMLEKLNS